MPVDPEVPELFRNAAGFDRLISAMRRQSSQGESGEPNVTAQLALMHEYAVTGWGIPSEYGGSGIEGAEIIGGYRQLASACLTSTFVFTQRQAAISRIAASENADLKAGILPRLAANDVFATVGISHLTTSRQHLKQPAVEAVEDGEGYRLGGTLPWVTAAAHADVILCGGTLADGRQLLTLVDTSDAGVSLKEPPPMLALNESKTGAVELDNVVTPRDHLVAGPIEAVMKSVGSGGTGSLTTSALALGAAAGSIDFLEAEAAKRNDLHEVLRPLRKELSQRDAELEALATGITEFEGRELSSESIRKQANSLALRSSQALLAASKGAGFVKGHPAERAVREAMFFLVWSCPQPVVTANLREFACAIG
ncbi:acyl-CoA dehydrogenase family protein [Stratiformator vulcanicus]|uniref:Acyl-CoA dehydrogenase n=1 Tax=Stratiformator vulcanicus TaxID=2527980 RepID=A0A517QWI9_9PLAN|nr:acyl-CoA dehydrogenase family protein [Stratiformator vulcanicus]QDT35943.1 hypothetical protein Pan189_02960 [Stratiformator vulcanicus]